jgi:orotate phosphoribosyltransferase
MEQQFLSLVSRRRGHFQLESGHHGDLWFELETLCQYSRQLQPFAAQLATKLRQYQVEVACGPLVEGAFIALLVSLEMGCDFVYAERFPNTARPELYTVEYRLPAALRPVVKNKRVAIVNDFINAGSAVIGTFADLQSIGANVVAIGALLSLGDTIHAFAGEHHMPLELLKHMPNNLWAPSGCPLCAAGQPIEIVGTS